MLLVHSKSAFVPSQEKTFPFRFALWSEYHLPVFIALSQTWGNVERPFLWQVVLCFLCILFRFHIFFYNWKWEISSIIRCISFLLLDPSFMAFICVCEPLTWRSSLLLVVNVDVPRSADWIPLSRALGMRKNKPVLGMLSLRCTQRLKRSEPCLAPSPLLSKNSFVKHLILHARQESLD